MNQEVIMEMMVVQQQQQSGYGGGVAAECHRAGPRPGVAATSPAVEEDTEEQEPQQQVLRRGPWTVDEDLTLINYIAEHGEGRWNALARAAGLKRTGKSCRLRWLNYLRPDVKRGDFTADEQLLILDLHSRWGNRWSKIASQLPGRTDNEIKNYWRTRVQKHAKQLNCDVNSRRFKDAMRFLWMPRLAERASAAASVAAAAGNHHHAAAPTTTTTDEYHHRRSPSATASSSVSSTATTTSSSSQLAAADYDDWAAAVAADDLHDFWSTASALQHLNAADHHHGAGAFQADDLISGWVQGFSEAGANNIISASSSSDVVNSNSLWSLDDIWRTTMHC